MFYLYCFRFARQTECFTHFLRKDVTDLRLKVDHSDIKKKKKNNNKQQQKKPGHFFARKPRAVAVSKLLHDRLSTPNLFRSTKREEPYREEESPVVSQKFLISSQEMPLAVPYSALCLARFRVYILEKLT